MYSELVFSNLRLLILGKFMLYTLFVCGLKRGTISAFKAFSCTVACIHRAIHNLVTLFPDVFAVDPIPCGKK